MFISKMKRKAGSTIRHVKVKVKHIVAREPKMKFYYWSYYQKCKVKEGVCLFESFKGTTFSGAPYYLLKELALRQDVGQYSVYVSVTEKSYTSVKAFIEEKQLPAILVKNTSKKYLELLASAKYLVNNRSFPGYFIRKEEQVYMNTGSGIPIKTMGKSVRTDAGRAIGSLQEGYLGTSYLVQPDCAVAERISGSFYLDRLFTGKIVYGGLPQAGIFLDKEYQKEIRKQFVPEGMTAYAYMPTWSGTGALPSFSDYYKKELTANLKFIDGQLKESQIMYVHFHPMAAPLADIGGFKHIRGFPEKLEPYEFLCCVDALVTDYSSVIYDFAVTGKPAALFMQDYVQYKSEHGLAVDIDALPFKIYKTKQELGEALSDGTLLQAGYSIGYTGKEPYAGTSGRLVSLLLSGNPGGLEIKDYSYNREKPVNVVCPAHVRGRSGFKTLAGFVCGNDIIQISKKQLNKENSIILYDEYKDSFQIVVASGETPLSFMEALQAKAGVQKVKDRIASRSVQRMYPGLKVALPFIRNVSVALAGCNTDNIAKRQLQSEIVYADGKIGIKIYDKGRYIVQKLFLQDNKNELVCERLTTQKEREEGTIWENFSEWKNILKLKARYQFMGEVYDREDETVFITAFSNKYLAGKIDSNKEKYDKSDAYLTPLFIGNPGTPGDGDSPAGELYAVLPYMKDNHSYSFVVCKPEHMIEEHTQARLLKMKSGKSGVKLYMKLKKHDGMQIKGFVLRYRSVLTYDIQVPYKIEESSTHYKIIADIDFLDMTLRELYWDPRIIVEQYGIAQEIRIRFPNDYWKCKFYLTNLQYTVGGEHMLFPYYTVGDCIAFVYRTCSPYDVYSTKIKDMAACALYIFMKPYLQKKKIWLVYEKFCTMAQDNGYYFFKYCMEKLPEEEKKNIYYVIDKKAPDYERLKPYDDHVLQFMSLRHCLYILGAVLYVGSDARSHLYAWRSKTSLVRSKMVTRPVFFLQHGVTALKDVSKIFGVNGSSAMTYFTTTSQFEQNIVVEYLRYKKEDAPITGFTRWDVLEDASDKDDRLVLAMPTWRSWLEEVSDEEFLDSGYYKNYSHLLQNEKLEELLIKSNTRMVFYIHPKFAGYLKNFDKSCSHVTLVPFGTQPLNELIKKCHMLVTDYSSVCWDVYYQKKPVIFYQFDYAQYEIAHGSFINMETELFGRRAVDEEHLLRHMEECINSGFAMLPEDLSRHHYYYGYIDNNNSQRTYQYLRKKGY